MSGEAVVIGATLSAAYRQKQAGLAVTGLELVVAMAPQRAQVQGYYMIDGPEVLNRGPTPFSTPHRGLGLPRVGAAPFSALGPPMAVDSGNLQPVIEKAPW